MPKYCFDTSGLSNPYEEMPEDIHRRLWIFVKSVIKKGDIAVTKEVFDEMVMIDTGLGNFIKQQKDEILYEVNQGNWDWKKYISNSSAMVGKHKSHISEYIGGSPKTVCLNDISIISLAATLSLPVVSMEIRVLDLSQTIKRKIPNICDEEDIVHHTFNEFLRLEGYKG